jgi:8-oxo-dGTP pyrophosphatase MutT (NUDIX family)
MDKPWHALKRAQARHVARVPFHVGAGLAGSVAVAHLQALRAWPGLFAVTAQGVRLEVAPAERDAALALVNAALHGQGLVRGWRDEVFAIVDLGSGAHLAHTERAAARFWGTLTLGAHATGYVADATGRPTHLWLARRADDKATDPGLWDNLIGGGVPAGQTPLQALVREAHEEAGLSPSQVAGVNPGRIVRLHRDIPEGLQREHVYSHDLCLPPGLVPHNVDGEVAGFELLPVREALARAAGPAMTVDAALVTLDFALRHGLVAPMADTQDVITAG